MAKSKNRKNHSKKVASRNRKLKEKRNRSYSQMNVKSLMELAQLIIS